MLKVNKIFTDPIQMSKAIDARKERLKRENDYKDNRIMCECEDEKMCRDCTETEWSFQGEYSKQKLARQKYKKRVELCLWIVVGIIIIVGLLN